MTLEPGWYLINDQELFLFATNGFWDRAERMKVYCNVKARYHAPTDKIKTSGTGGGTHSILGEPVINFIGFPNSTELIEMAHREWKNRQERKGHDDAVPWASGWISGYLTGRGSQ